MKPYPYIIPPESGSIEEAELGAMEAEPEPSVDSADEAAQIQEEDNQRQDYLSSMNHNWTPRFKE